MNACDEDTAKHMGKSLLKHAREIHRYATTYCEPNANNDYLDDKRRAKFTGNLERMIENMYGLMLLAKYKGVSRYCNREQIEAYMEAAADIVSVPDALDRELKALLN